MRKLSCYSCLLLCVTLSASINLRGQAASVRDCTPVLAKDYYSYAMKNDLQEDFLRSVDDESFKQTKDDITTKGSAYGGAFTGENDYSKFDDERKKYLETVHYSRSQQQALDILQITTSDRAYTAYETCLRTISTGPALLVWASRESMNEIDLRVKYINGASVKGIELYGTVNGGSVAGEPAGMIWSEGAHWWSTNENKWGVNQEKAFTLKRTPGSAETTVTVKASDGSSPFKQTFKRADAVLTLSYVGTTDVYRNARTAVANMPDNNENRSTNCPNYVGLHDGKYCTSRTPMTITATAPRFLRNAAVACNPAACGWLFQGPASITADELTASAYVDNWGSPMQVWLKADEYEHLSSAQCGSDDKVPVILGHPVLFSAPTQCGPIAQIIWKTLTGIPSQGSLPFSWTMSKGGEVAMVGDLSESGSIRLASYKLNKLDQ